MPHVLGDDPHWWWTDDDGNTLTVNPADGELRFEQTSPTNCDGPTMVYVPHRAIPELIAFVAGQGRPKDRS